MEELSQQQLARQDYVDNSIYNLITQLNSSTQEFAWNIEMIADIRERVRYWLVEYYHYSDEMTFYPYLPE